MDTSTGRFWSMDTDEGRDLKPFSLHKYLYASADPVGRVDPSGNDDLASLAAAGIVLTTLAVTTFTILLVRGNLSQGDAEQPPSANATSTNGNSIEIVDSKWKAEDFFQFMASYRGVNDGDVATLSGGPVSGVGQKLTFQLHSNSLLGVLSLIGQSSFSIKSRRFDPEEGTIGAVTLQGHPLRGYRYWRVFSPDGRPGHFVLQTGALDEPGPGPFDGLKFYVGRTQQLRIWQEYLQDALQLSGGQEGSDSSFDNPGGEFGTPSPGEVRDEISVGTI